MATPSNVQLPDSPASGSSQAPNLTMVDKPLPSPPVAQIVKASPKKETRSLIDASEKPLRRSPPGMPHHEEEWPVLSPEKPTTPGTLRQMTHQDSPKGSPKPLYRQQERYPMLPSTSYHAMSKPENPTSIISSGQKIQRKMIPPTNLPSSQNTSINPNNTGILVTTNIVQTEEKLGATPDISPRQGASKMRPSDRSAGAAAIEKSIEDSKPINQPRQTRTSSLRARLSAGQLIKDPTGKSKTVGFTDFTSDKQPSAQPSEGNPRAPKVSHNRSASPLNARPGTNFPKDSVPGNRAPAQFVAGSRHPTHRRPSSRGSLHGHSRASSPPLVSRPPIPSAPGIPYVTQESITEAVVDEEKSKIDGARTSSIPVFRHTVSDLMDGAKDGKVLQPHKNKSAQPHLVPRNEFSIYEDRDVHHPTALQVIKESPNRTYEIKRLSMTSPEHGPILRISPSADRLIMGIGSDKENQPKSSRSKSQDARHNAMASGMKNGKGRHASVSIKKPVQRPASSQGLPQFAFRRGLVDAGSREKKVKSADLSYSLPASHVAKHSTPSTTNMSRKNTGSSTADDPFFDAIEALGTSLNSTPAIDEAETKSYCEDYVESTGGASWITPIVIEGRTSWNDTTPNCAEYIPITLQEHVKKGIQGDYKHSETRNESGAATDESDEPVAKLGKASRVLGLPTTPTQTVQTAGHPHCESFPPRSSSHAAHPDHTVNGSAKVSPLSFAGRMNNVLQKSSQTPEVDLARASEFVEAHQNENAAYRVPGLSQAEKTNLASKRDSTARESNKSQGSLSKGMLSNFRGLFHKRSSDSTELFSGKLNRKNKQFRVTSSGSPFPPISEPVADNSSLYRPTLASMNRSKAIVADVVNPAPTTPSFASPIPSEVSKTTQLAMEILDLARSERSPPKQQKFLELGKIMVDAVTQARDVEKSMEEAKQAARKAEMACTMCMKSLEDVARSVEQWRDEVTMM